MNKPGIEETKKELSRLHRKHGVYQVTRRGGDNKKVKNAKIVVFDGIEFKSGLELFCYRKLKEAGAEFSYEAHTFTIFPPVTCGFPSVEQVGVNKVFKEANTSVRPITYTPDFTDKECAEFIIECKGYKNEVFPLKLKMFKKLLTESDFKGTYYLPRNQKQITETISLILKRRLDGHQKQ